MYESMVAIPGQTTTIALFIWDRFLYPRLALNSLCWGRPWTSNPPSSLLWVLRLQAYTPGPVYMVLEGSHPRLCACSIDSYIPRLEEVFSLNYFPSSFMRSCKACRQLLARPGSLQKHGFSGKASIFWSNSIFSNLTIADWQFFGSLN
jgi:hypothetical protein